MYKDKYKDYEDLKIIEFEDDFDFLDKIVHKIENGEYKSVDIFTHREMARYLMEQAISPFFNCELISGNFDNVENKSYVIEIFDNKSFVVLPYGTHELYGDVGYVYQGCNEEMINRVYNDYNNPVLFGFNGEMEEFVHGDSSDLDVNMYFIK